jgi:hypothetical protein
LAACTGTREGLKVQLLGVVGGEVSQDNLVKVLRAGIGRAARVA